MRDNVRPKRAVQRDHLLRERGAEMSSWLPHRRARMERIDAEAEELIRESCDDAYFEAIRRENEASSDAIAKDWSRVALAVAHKLKTSTEVDPPLGSQ